MGHLIGSKPQSLVVLIGFPSDKGVELNGGRTGASAGPHAIRSALYRLAPGSQAMTEIWERTHDLGDCRLTGPVARDQEALAELIGPVLADEKVVIVLGGGHETAFGHFLGYALSGAPVSILNVDAHADVRPLLEGSGHSGSSFRQALEFGPRPAVSYTVFGLARHASSRSHVQYLSDRECRWIWNDHATTDAFDGILSDASGDTMVSFDLDAFDESSVPGVSAPNPDGLDPSFGFHAAHVAGRSPRVTSIDVCELNPDFDVDNRSARFAAMLVWFFVEGLAGRFTDSAIDR